ncbi:GNAT family N-acetyltransferase [Fictibacillus nanhaiensis]|uniref:GNAT family N-acetyltransferase n=1 Tax=Fictibacillus nanhaiensis TaxID=742169 RepID=UPI001C96C75C|nr:GNAT family N-acetyltransferase [Fictibacillus nanhaiensis]MBY6036791.1 GNAT family N-acetyltransferase [Fictibacillus nanhaiensis]
MKIRRAVVEDAAHIAKVHVDSWQQSYKGLIDSAYLNNMSVREREERWKEWLSQGPSHIVFVLEDKNNILCGFISGGNARSHDSFDSEVYAFYLVKSVQRKGYGTQLLKKFSEALLTNEKKSLIVWVLKDNPAKRVYVSLGGIKIDEETISIGDQQLAEECFGWENLSLIMK